MKRKTIPIALASALMLALPLSLLSSCGGEKHQYASTWSSDSTDHWHACTIADHADVADKGAHDFDNGKITKEATEDAEGVKTYTCSTCNYQKYESIAKLPHTHTFDTAVWASDEENHWHPSTCGHADEKDALAAHVWDEGEVTSEATEEEEGVITYTCSVCGETKEETISVIPHTHTFSDAWSKDETGHWHAATCEHTDQKSGFAEHSGTWTTKEEATYLANRVDQRDCEVCGYHEEKEIPDTILPAQDRELSVAEIADVSFDGLEHPISDSQITRTNDEGGLTIEYREEGEEEYSTEVPVEVGDYEYRVTLKGTSQWKEKVVTGGFSINPLTVVLTDTSFEDPMISSGYIVLSNIYTTEDGKNISDATNGWTDSVSLLAPSIYGEVGRNTVPSSKLYLDDDNFILDRGSIENVEVIRYDTRDFIAGVTDSFYVTGRGPAVTVEIEKGTVASGDKLYVCELGKEVTVSSISISNVNKTKATVGDANVALLLSGVTKGEITNGMLLAKTGTVKAHRSAIATISLYSSATYALLDKDTRPAFSFSATSISLSGRIALPSGVEQIGIGETVENVVVDFSSVIGNWAGRTFYLKNGTNVIGAGTITEVHDHDFGDSGVCSCGVSNVTSGTWSESVLTCFDYFYLGEERGYTCNLSRPIKASPMKYTFSLSDSHGDSFDEGFEFKVYSAATNEEITLDSDNSFTKTTVGQLPIKVVVTKTGGSQWFEYCCLTITRSVA